VVSRVVGLLHGYVRTNLNTIMDLIITITMDLITAVHKAGGDLVSSCVVGADPSVLDPLALALSVPVPLVLKGHRVLVVKDAASSGGAMSNSLSLNYYVSDLCTVTK